MSATESLRLRVTRLGRRVLRSMPGRVALIRALSTAPAAFKGRYASRVYLRVFEHSELAELGTLRTNLGMPLDVAVSADALPIYFFGTPDAYEGERGTLLLCRELCKTSDAFIDVGANHGYFTFFVHVGLTRRIPIHYFEPVTRLFSEIDANVKRNALTDIHGHPCAVGAVSGPVTFHTNMSDSASSSLTSDFQGKHRVTETRVDCVRFDDFVRDNGLRNLCVKVDVEGAEVHFLEGAQAAADSLRCLIIEVLGPAVQAGFIQKAKQQLGMHAYYINDLQLEHSEDGAFTYQHPEYNWLFCRESPAQLRELLAGSRLVVND